VAKTVKVAASKGATGGRQVLRVIVDRECNRAAKLCTAEPWCRVRAAALRSAAREPEAGATGLRSVRA
jgi:hypothetical protein